MVKDLTQGEPSKILLRFTLPMFISVMFQQMYQIADSFIAGRFGGGEHALASIGASYPITMIFMAVAIGCNNGCSVVIASLFGQKRMEDVKTAIKTALLSATALAALMTILGLVFSKFMLQSLDTPLDVFYDANTYLMIFIGGFWFLFIYNIANGIFSALGDSTTPLWFLIGSSVGNVILDLVFVIVFKLGVMGVAWATFIAQGIAGMLSLTTLLRRMKKLSDKNGQIFSTVMLRKIIFMSAPSVFQQSFVSVGNLFIQKLVNGFGTAAIAGYSSAIKLNTFAVTSFTTMSGGISTFTAQNIGAGRQDRVVPGLRSSIKIVGAIALTFTAVYFIAAKDLIRVFMSEPSVDAVSIGASFLRIAGPFYLVISIKILMDGILRGSKFMLCFMISTFTDLILRVILAYIFAYIWKVNGIWLSWPVGWSIACILSTSFAIRAIKRNFKK